MPSAYRTPLQSANPCTPANQVRKSPQWWKKSLRTLPDLEQAWPILMAIWSALPREAANPQGSPAALSAEDRLRQLPAEQQEVAAAIEALLTAWVPDLRRNVTLSYIGYADRRIFVELVPRVDSLMVGVRLGELLDDREAAGEWRGNKSYPAFWHQPLRTMADLERIRPALEKAYAQQRQPSADPAPGSQDSEL